MGQEYAKQGRCHYCIKRKTKEDKEGSIRSRRTAYTCSEHPDTYFCKSVDGVDAAGQELEI